MPDALLPSTSWPPDRDLPVVSRGRLPEAWRQTVLVAGVLALTALFARLGLGALDRIFFILAALALGGYYVRRSPWLFLTLAFWFWTITPLARRLVDFYAGFDPLNYMLATPNLLSMLMLADILRSRELLRRREAVPGMFLLLPVAYGTCVSLLQGDIVPAAAAAADWIPPLLYYFYIIAHWRIIADAEKPFRQFLLINGSITVVYGIVQFFAPLKWDVAWVIDSGMMSIGKPVPYGLRVFGMLNAPGLEAIWIGALLLLSMHFRGRITILLLPGLSLLLLMTGVRSVAGITVMALLAAGLSGRGQILKVLGISIVALGVLGAGTAALNPKMVDQFSKRFSTLNDLQSDDSAIQREAIYRSVPALVDADPFGLGIGAIGRGAVAGQNAGMVTVDAGPLAIYLALGWVAGSIYLAGVGLVLLQALVEALFSRSNAAFALAIAAFAGAANLAFTNMTGVFAAIVWTCAAYAAALGMAARLR